jgi:hypothetical protein
MHKESSFNRTGRVITAHFAGIDIVNSYTPTTHTDDSKDARRLIYDTEFSQFLSSFSRTPILCGDLNTAPDFTDCTLWVAPSKSSEPASKEFELKAHTDMVNSLGLVDCYKQCNSLYLDDLRQRGHHLTWSRTAALMKAGKGKRLDHFLAPKSLFLPSSSLRIAGCAVHPRAFGSDHRPIILRTVDTTPCSDPKRTEPSFRAGSLARMLTAADTVIVTVLGSSSTSFYDVRLPDGD